MAEHTAYPSLILLTGGDAEAIPAEVEPDLERDIGACCRLGGPPRYQVAGVERPDFDPTVPSDVVASGWRWLGGWLVYRKDWNDPNCGGIVIGLPVASLDDIWAKARAFNTAAADCRARIDLKVVKRSRTKKAPPVSAVAQQATLFDLLEAATAQGSFLEVA